MKANELMIGDWVHYINPSNNRVVGVGDFTAPEELEPIPLTAEILEKNGFVKVNSQRYDWGSPNGFYVNINPKKKIIHINGANGSNCNMYYIIVGFNVHELQHALRLCGLIDLADSFKVE